MKTKLGRFIAFLLILSMLGTTLCGLTAAYTAEDIVLAPGQTEFSIDVTIPGVSEPFASADIDVIIDDGSALDIETVSFPGSGVGSVSDPRTSGAQVSYMLGFGSSNGQNQFSGNVSFCTVKFTYSGTQPRVITMRNIRLHRYAGVSGGIPQYSSETLSLEYVYNISVGGGQALPVATPTASPAAGTYNTAQTVTLSCATAGARIYYSTNGKNPTDASTLYTAPFTVDKTTTVKAIATRSGLEDSEVATFEYVIDQATTVMPSASPAAGTYRSAQQVTLSSNTDGASIYYTTNGGDPTTQSTHYTAPINVSQTTIIKAIAVKAGLNDSPVATFSYTIRSGDSGEVFDDDTPPLSGKPVPKLSVEKAYLFGYTDGTVRPSANITRAETAGLLYSLVINEDKANYKQFASNFSDVGTDKWYSEAVGYFAAAEVISGYPDGTFRGGNAITRAEFASILSKLEELNTEGDVPFTDIETHWARNAIRSAYRNKWISGYPDNTFRPNLNITRYEAVVMVNRMTGRVLSLYDAYPMKFSDVAAGAWYYQDIVAASNDRT